jgi:hypothetical protein
LGTSNFRSYGLDLAQLSVPSLDISSIEHYFTEEEVWGILRTLPPDKEPGLDGFTWHFYQADWPIIKRDVIQALAPLWSLDGRSFYLLNQAYMILLHKKSGAKEVKDFRPINLIHSFSKLFAKLLLARLAPFMSELVLPKQSAFIKGRAIHDNFMAVHSAAKLLHTRRRPSVLHKVDIAKAFDAVNWSFLLELLRHMGFTGR